MTEDTIELLIQLENDQLTELVIEDESIDIIRLANALKKTTRLQKLQLFRNNEQPNEDFQILSWQEMKALASALVVNATLENLELNSISYQDEGSVNLIIEAVKRIPTLQKFSLSNSGSTRTPYIVEALKSNPSLKTLILENNYITDQDLVAIARSLKENSTLEHLWLSPGNGRDAFSDEGAIAIGEMLKQNKSLKTLRLNYAMIGDEGAKAIMEALKQNNSLEYLDLGNSNTEGDELSDELAKVTANMLKQNKALKILDLKMTNIGDEGAKAIANALEQNSSLEHLDLHGNTVKDGGAKAFAELLTKNRILRFLDLTAGEITLIGLHEIFCALINNMTLLSFKFSNIVGNYDGLSKHMLLQIQALVIRNRAIAKCFSDINIALIKGEIRSATKLDEAIKELKRLIPNIGTEMAPLEDDHPIAENYRLLCGLRCIMQSDLIELDTWLDGFDLLTIPFQQSDFQKLADRGIGHALFVTSAFKKLKSEEKVARYQLILYYYRSVLTNPDIENDIKICLLGLKDLTKDPVCSKLSLSMLEIVGSDKLLSYEDVRAIAQKALQLSQDEHEINYLNRLLLQLYYDHGTCNNFWQCQSFRDQFERDYPGSNTFRILENYIQQPFVNAEESKAANVLSAVPFQLFSLTDPLIMDTDFVAFLDKKKELVRAIFAEKAAESSSDDVIMHDVEGGLSSSPQKRKRSASIDFQFNRDGIQRDSKRKKPDDEIGVPQSNFNPKGPG